MGLKDSVRESGQVHIPWTKMTIEIKLNDVLDNVEYQYYYAFRVNYTSGPCIAKLVRNQW